MSVNAPSLPYNPAQGFTFHDCWTAVDVEMDGRGLLAKANCACTLFTREVFPGSQQIHATVTLLDLKQSIIGIGILGERAAEACRTNCVGHSDILDSIGCAVGRGEVIIVFKGRTLFRAPVVTNNRLEVLFELVNGRASFAINGNRLNCPDLTKLNLSKGRFRMGVSPTKQGQAAIFASAAQLAALAGGGTSGVPTNNADANAPVQGYSTAAGFTFHDRWRSMDVVEGGRALICRHSVKGTTYSEQVFKGSVDFRATFRLVNRAQGGVMAFGVVGHQSTKQCADFVVGEKEIPDSIGAVVKDNSVVVVFKDDIIFSADVAMLPHPEIAVIFKGGHLRFELDGRNLNCEALKELNFGDGHFRVAASLTEESQSGELIRFGNDGNDPDAVVSVLDSRVGIIFHDRWRSMDVVENTGVVCRHSVKGTTYSKQVFKGSVDARFDLRVANCGNNAVLAFGILGHGSTKQCADFVLGEKEIPDSIGCIIKGGTLAVMFKDDLVFQAEPGIPANPVISVIFTGGHLRFELDGRNLDCEKIKNLNFGSGHFRIGVSYTQEGQAAELVGGSAGGGGGSGAAGPDSADVPTPEYDGGKFTFHDRWKSMDVVNATALVCRHTMKGTTYSNQVFRGNFNFKQAFKFTQRKAGVVAFGFLAMQSTKQCADFVLGEKELPDSIGAVLKGNILAIMFNDDIIFQAEVQMEAQPVVTVVFQNGDVRFELDGRNIDCEDLRKLNLGSGKYRLGVSMTEEGQAGNFVNADGSDPNAMKEDVIEGEKDITYKWIFSDKHASRDGASVNSKERGGKAFSLQVFSTETMPEGLVCDGCFRGDDDRRKFDCHRWKCGVCPDFDFCNDCYHSQAVKHKCDRKVFKATLGGSFHEMRFTIAELLGNTIDIGIVRRGAEDKFGEDSNMFVTAGPSGWTRGKMTVLGTPAKSGDEVWIRVATKKLVVYANRRVVYKHDIADGAYRFAVRFGRDGQSLSMIRRLTLPARGVPVEVSGDKAFLDQEAQLVGLDPQYLKEGVRGWLIEEDVDGTVKLCLDDPATPTVWVPRTAILPLPQRTVPQPSMGSLAAGQKVVRNLTCWIFGQQDGGQRGNRIGTVVSADQRSVRVKWTSGNEAGYTYADGLYNVLAWIGNVGDRVVRNPAAFPGGSKGGYGPGTVESASPSGVLTVKWDNGDTGEYRFNEEAQEVQLAGAIAVPPLANGPSPNWAVPAAASASTSAATSPLTKNKNAPPPAAAAPAAASSAPPPPPGAPPQVPDAAAPPAPPTSAPAPANAVERVRGAESANLMDVNLKPAMRLKASYKPPKPLDACMMDAKSALPKVSEMEFIVEQCTAIAKDRRTQNGNELEVDEAMSIALYTFDLGTMGDCPMGSDNFYYVLNEIFRSRDQQALFALQPFMYYFKMAWKALPNVTGTFYRGIPKSALSLVSNMYGAGREVYWSSITSLSVDREVAEKFAAKEGGGGVLMEVAVVDSRSICKYSAIPREGEVILEPNTRLIVTQPVTPAGGINILKLMQVKHEKAFVF